MKYLDSNNLLQLGFDWPQLAGTIEKAVQCLYNDDAVQPIKPYLRFKDLTNRIISMPAYVGGDFDVAGIKWITSFPGNIHLGIPRAHSLTILNNANTGEPMALINTALISVIRTVAVSAMLIERYKRYRNLVNPSIGILGFGPIGQYHLKMILSYFDNADVRVFDLKKVDTELMSKYDKVSFVDSWQEAYDEADIFITCTVSSDRYIDRQPKPNSLHLNVSLRDYKPEMMQYFREGMIVDNWEETCRESTDVEIMHKKYGLTKEMTKSIDDVVVGDCLKEMAGNHAILFNPMGMSIFDIAVAKYFYDKAVLENNGLDLTSINKMSNLSS